MRRAAVPAALLVVVVLAPGAQALAGPPAGSAQPSSGALSRSTAIPSRSPAGTAADLPQLERELAAATREAQRLSDLLEQAAGRDGGLRVAVDRLAQQHDDAQARLDARVRQIYMAGSPGQVPDPLGALRSGLTAPGLAYLSARGQAGAVRVDQQLVDAVSQQSAQVIALRLRAEQFRAGLSEQAQAVLVVQDRARTLLASARQLAAREQQAAARRAATDRAAAQAGPADAALQAAQTASARDTEQAQAAAALARLDGEQASLDAVSAAVTQTLTPATTRRSTRSQAAEAPVLALVEAAGAGYPQGYRPTGQVITGSASWYGPGLVGSPTASGTPYDPERLTCANKQVPLGTVLHVTANGRAVNCLVNDRGPYVGDRVIDMSRAGSRALGYDGLAQVVAQVLEPG